MRWCLALIACGSFPAPTQHVAPAAPAPPPIFAPTSRGPIETYLSSEREALQNDLRTNLSIVPYLGTASIRFKAQGDDTFRVLCGADVEPFLDEWCDPTILARAGCSVTDTKHEIAHCSGHVGDDRAAGRVEH